MLGRKTEEKFQALRGKPSDYDGNRIGLTEAFAPVSPEGATNSSSTARAGVAGVDGSSTAAATHEEDAKIKSARHVRTDASDVSAGVSAAHGNEPASSQAFGVPSAEPAYQKKSRRVRKVLAVVIVLLIVLLAALVYFSYRLINESKTLASQQTQEQTETQDVDALTEESTNDAFTDTSVAQKTDPIALVSLFGLTQDEAIAAVAHGASVTATHSVDDEASEIKTELTLSLTDEVADSRSGTPSVYLSLNEEGRVIRAGYSVATASLGYGAVSFADAVQTEHIVESALREVGLSVEDGAVTLPADRNEYSSYDSDGTTLLKETCSFAGTGTVDGVEHAWEAVLLYDYASANASGNLNDTVRMIYVYIDD